MIEFNLSSETLQTGREGGVKNQALIYPAETPTTLKAQGEGSGSA